MSQNKQQSFILNLFGTGVQLWDLDLPNEAMLKLATHQQKFNLTWEELIFNLEIVEKLGYHNWTEFAKPLTPIRLAMDVNARIELRKKGRLVELISAKEVCAPTSLFSRYEVTNYESVFEPPKQLRLMIRYKGLVSKFNFQDESFRMDTLEFNLDAQNVKNEILLNQISLQGVPLVSVQDDLLLVRGEVINTF
jgi:hypothetical protein